MFEAITEKFYFDMSRTAASHGLERSDSGVDLIVLGIISKSVDFRCVSGLELERKWCRHSKGS